jgi:membrane protein DedA with SNARE-associated domain
MLLYSSEQISHWISVYGYGVVMGLNLLESLSLPVPGETALIAAAAYAGTTHKLNIWLLITTTAGATITGDVISFLLGNWLGFWIVNRHGQSVGLNPARVKLGQYLFMRYGTWVVFVGRFLSVLRGPIAFLSGANKMRFRRFLLAAGTGSALWALVFGFGPYLFGAGARHLAKPVGLGLTALAIALLLGMFVFLQRNEARLEAEAERCLPGPVGPLHGPDI